MDEHPEVHLLLVGGVTLPDRLAQASDRIIHVKTAAHIDTYWDLLCNVDINIAVLGPSSVNSCKSEIKWLEAAVFGVPTVVSATASYAEVVQPGVDALVCRTEKDWTEALKTLVTDGAARSRIGQAARRKALEMHSPEKQSATLGKILASVGVRVPGRMPPKSPTSRQPAPLGAGPVPSDPAAASEWRPRLLVVNVFFPPQSIGGATRVVHDQVDHLIDSGITKSLEVCLVTTDEGVQPAYQMRVTDYRGLPVFRISTPLEAGMDWRFENPETASIFRRICETWAPDLVHFHCIQRLTASVVRVARDLRVPYLISLHDGWWIGRSQFLTDQFGRLDPIGRTPLLPPEPSAVEDWLSDISRRSYLADCLDGAHALIAVSKPFADLHRRAGFTNVTVIENGVPRLPTVRRRPSDTKRVRLAHIGGMATHKGFPLVEAVLRSTRFRNLELLVLDHALEPGDSFKVTWGTTPVLVAGRYAQDQVDALYERMDVLLAPSIWPESYGLVAREATAAGIWVVASDRGAVGADITPSINGFVVDVSGIEGLRDALLEIDANPAKYKGACPVPKRMRTSTDQAREQVALYKRVLTGIRNARAEGRRKRPKEGEDGTSTSTANVAAIERRA